MGCEIGENYKKKNFCQGTFSMKVQCSFMLRFVSSGSGLKVKVRLGFQNHEIAMDLDGHDILGCLKHNEGHFLNDITKYNMVARYIVVALKDRDPKNLTNVTQAYKARSTCKTSKRGPLTKKKYLLSLIHDRNTCIGSETGPKKIHSDKICKFRNI